MTLKNTRRGQTQAQCSVGQALPDNVWVQTSPSRKRNSLISPLTCPTGILSKEGILDISPHPRYADPLPPGARAKVAQCAKDPAGEEHSASESSSPSRGKVGAARMRGYSLGFTLIEILVVVLIIGILGAIMLPQYQRAVLKSRFAALMPIAKSMADSNEAFYLEHGIYADNAEDLPVQGRRNYSDGTQLEFGTTSDYSYVLATRNNDFPNKYIVYQKHSEQFPGEIHCEAATDNTQAQEVCKSFGATEDIGETLTPGYLTYVLFGTGNGVAPNEDEDNDDEGGDEPGEPSTPTVTKMTAEEAQALADLKCHGCVGIANDDGTVSVCNYAGRVTDDGQCEATATNVMYEYVYDANGNLKLANRCVFMNSDGTCRKHLTRYYNADGSGGTQKERSCQSGFAVSKEGICTDGKYDTSYSADSTFIAGRYRKNNYYVADPTISEYTCSAIDTSGTCTSYSTMKEWIYDENNPPQTRTCTKINEETGKTCDTWSEWQ